jgi:hypothetical protein
MYLLMASYDYDTTIDHDVIRSHRKPVVLREIKKANAHLVVHVQVGWFAEKDV